MVASLRRSLIILLLLLQTAAPLVHAHVGEQFRFGGGLHLPTLESLNGEQHDHLSTAGQFEDWSQIVELGLAIKLPVIDASVVAALLPDSYLVVLPPKPCLLPVNFSPQPANLHLPPPFLSANVSRAPPR